MTLVERLRESLEREIEQVGPEGLTSEYDLLREAADALEQAEARIAELEEGWNLAMKSLAEDGSPVANLEARLAQAERLAEAAQEMVGRYEDIALGAYDGQRAREAGAALSDALAAYRATRTGRGVA